MPKIAVSGMSCNHCKKSVEEALAKLPGVQDVTVDLDAAEAVIQGQGVDPQAVKQTITDIGFQPGEYTE